MVHYDWMIYHDLPIETGDFLCQTSPRNSPDLFRTTAAIAQHQNPTLVVLPSAHAYSSESPVYQRGKTTSSSSCTHLSRLTHCVLIYAYRYDKYTCIPASSTVCVLFAFSGTSASLDLGNTYIYICIYICIYIHICVCMCKTCIDAKIYIYIYKYKYETCIFVYV